MTMLEPGEVQRRLGYHPVSDATRPAYELNRALAILLAEAWNQALPPGREAALALTALQEALMWANAAVACNAGDGWRLEPVDVSEQLDDITEHLEGPLHLRAQPVGGGGAVPGSGGGDIGPVEPVEGAERVLRGDCPAVAPMLGPQRCERVAGHELPHRRGFEVWS